MKKLLAFVLAAGLALSAAAAQAGWTSTGVFGPAPNQGDVVADTGALLAVAATMTVMISGNGDCEFDIAVRNSTNTADVQTHHFYYQALEHFSQAFPVTLLLNQRVIVRVTNYPTGYFQSTIVW